MKKIFAMLLTLVLAITLSACAEKTTTTKQDAVVAPFANVEDGYYFAASTEPASSYLYWVTLQVKGGYIQNVEWDGYNVDGGESGCIGYSKYTCSATGKYGMVAKGKASAEWHVQNDIITSWVLVNQSLDATFDAEGQANEIAGATIHSNDFFALAKQALQNPKVAAGTYRDGYYYVEGTRAPKTYTIKDGETTLWTETRDAYSFATFVVVNGRIVLSDINAANLAWETGTDGKAVMVDGKPKPLYLTKDVAKEWYGMNKASTLGAEGEWYKQAQRIETFLLANQGLDTMNVNATTNKTDSIASVTIKVNGYKDIWTAAKAKMSK